MTCPICHKRKAKRFCPARGDGICSVCCGTEREVTIDCPSDCAHLIACRQYDYERKEIDWEKMPFGRRRSSLLFSMTTSSWSGHWPKPCRSTRGSTRSWL